MANEIMTRNVARALRVELASQGLDILFDHGETGVDPVTSLGKVKSWFSQDYRQTTILADLDMAILLQGKDQVIALIEIEETSNKPKLLLGDVLATLLGSQITFQGKHHLSVGAWTTLIVLAYGSNPAVHGRIAFLEKEVNQLKGNLVTPNAKIGRIVIESFQSELDLEQKLRDHIQTAFIASKSVPS